MRKYCNILGLTGSIATGKSTVSRIFKKYGIPVIDADKIARDVVKKGSYGLKKIVDEFGKEYLNPDGTLNRKKLADLIFSNKEAKERLEKIIHPLVRRKEAEIIEKIREKDKDIPIVVDVPLLIETGSYKNYDKIIVVYVPESIQIERLMKRDGLTYEEALNRVRNQMNIEEKIKFADYVIDNSGSIEDTEKQVVKILEEIRWL